MSLRLVYIASVCAFLQFFSTSGGQTPTAGKGMSKLEESYIGLLERRFYTLRKELLEAEHLHENQKRIDEVKSAIGRSLFYEWALLHGPRKDVNLSTEFTTQCDQIVIRCGTDVFSGRRIVDPLGFIALAPQWAGNTLFKEFTVVSEFGPGIPITDELTRVTYDKMVDEFNLYLTGK